MSNLDYIEQKYGLSSDGDVEQRLERIRLHLANGLDHVDPESADKLRRYNTVDVIDFINHIVTHDRRKLS